MILVTGATGLLGSHLLFHLLQTENRVKALYRSERSLQSVKKVFSYYYDNPTDLYNKIDWVKADILDIPSLENAFIGVSKVYHSAAVVAFDRKTERLMNKVNVEGTANIVNLCNSFSVDKLCHVSSISTLAKTIDGSKITEEDFWNPDAQNSGYGISKNGAEMEVWRGIEEGLNAIIVNPSIILGPGYWDTSSGKIFASVKNGMRFYTNGKTGFVGVNDVAKTMIALMQSDLINERYIINSENSTYKTVFSTIAESMNLKAPSVEAKKWMLDIGWRVDGLFNLLFGTKPKLSKDSARSATNISTFSNEKIKNHLNTSFTSIDEVINDVSKIYLSELKAD
jgi:nucleoside-diphosphate-sugar epimerase